MIRSTGDPEGAFSAAEARAIIADFASFRADLLVLQRLLTEHERAVAAADAKRLPRPRFDPEAERLRGSLLRRAGPVQWVFERVFGPLVLPFAAYGGAKDIWQLVLYPGDVYERSSYARLLAERLGDLIEALKRDPSPLNTLKQRRAAGDRPIPGY